MHQRMQQLQNIFRKVTISACLTQAKYNPSHGCFYATLVINKSWEVVGDAQAPPLSDWF